MNKILVILIVAFSTTIGAVGQNIKIIEDNSPDSQHQTSSFNLIDKSFDLTISTKIATVQGYSLNNNNPTIVSLFNSFWKSANELGANSFYINNVVISEDSTIITLDLYYLNDNDSKKNLDLYPRNMVYVIGAIDKKQNSKTIKLNNQKVLLNPMEYVEYQNKIGEEATVSIGGLTGAKIWIKGQEGRFPKHLSVTGLEVGPGTYNTVGLSINTGRIYPVDLNLGQFLIGVLKKKELLTSKL